MKGGKSSNPVFGKQIAPRSQKLSQLNSDRTDIAKECDNCRRTKLARINRTFRMGTDAERARQAFCTMTDKYFSINVAISSEVAGLV